MTKKIVITVIAIITVGIIIAIYKMYSPCPQENISIPINEKDSKIAISQKIIDAYLKNHRSGKVCLRGIIKDYKINEIKTEGFRQNGENSFAVTASFSVKPFLSNIYWVQKNGKAENNGWISNNPAFIIITKNNKFYQLKEIIVKKII